jgi:hypothetical protein
MSLVELEKHGRRLKPALLAKLTEKHRLVLAHLVYGPPDGDGKPMSIAEAADRLKVRRAYIRDLVRDPLFRAEFAQATAALRLGRGLN